MNVYGKKIYLRAMEPEDMEMYREMANDPETERLLGGWSFPISKREQLSWYERAVSDKNNLRFTIVVQETEEAIGMLNLVDIDWKNGSAFHGIRLSGNKGKRNGQHYNLLIAGITDEEYFEIKERLGY
ncbi:MAG: GNAT family N-acetyltransferase [Eubacterium sp.]|nr:GNAT family N-acetyltransferase [Eubacterium sp.]